MLTAATAIRAFFAEVHRPRIRIKFRLDYRKPQMVDRASNKCREQIIEVANLDNSDARESRKRGALAKSVARLEKRQVLASQFSGGMTEVGPHRCPLGSSSGTKARDRLSAS
jgi:hypothetical protein